MEGVVGEALKEPGRISFQAIMDDEAHDLDLE